MGTRSHRHVDLRLLGSGSFLLLLVVLAVTSEPRLTGDGPEYAAQALRLSTFHLPAVTDAEAVVMNPTVFAGYAREKNTLTQLDDAYGDLKNPTGRMSWPHFWFYPLLAVPFLWATQAMGVRLLWAFTLLNILLLAAAFWIVSGRLRWPAAVLLFVSPIIWWIDKAHTEVMTFSLLCAGLGLLGERPWWSAVALGAAATQNSFLALGIPILCGAAILDRPGLARDRRLRAGVATGIALTALKPCFYLWQLGVAEPQTLIDGVRFHVPTVEEAGLLLWDPNIGLLHGFPILLAVAAIAAVTLALRAPVVLRSPWPWALVVFGLVILLSAAQTTNLNSSATPSMSRYALMLIPLTIPLLLAAQERLGRGFERVLVVLTGVSIVSALLNYHPRVEVHYLRPTRLARFLWTHHPALDNPPPEVFSDRITHTDHGRMDRLPPAATPTCSKVLLADGVWPRRCASGTPLPPACRRPLSYCYANRAGERYRFVEAFPDRSPPPVRRPRPVC